MVFQRIEAKEKEDLQKTKPTEVTPNSNYKDKYAHLIGQDAALKAAKKTETNKSYGFGKRPEKFHPNILLNIVLFSSISVPSENKRDNRTIEDVQADLQAKKRMKLTQAAASVTATELPSNDIG